MDLVLKTSGGPIYDGSQKLPKGIENYVILESSDGHQFFIREECAKRSGTIGKMLESQGPFVSQQTRTLKFSEISKQVLEIVCRYLLYKHHYSVASNIAIPEFEIPSDMAVDLVVVANFLDC